MEHVKVVRGLGWETGGDLSIALEEISRDEDTIVMNGDLETDIKISEMYEFHKKKRPLSTISVFELDSLEEARRFGRISIDRDGRVLSFDEKKDIEETPPVKVNTGFYILDRELVKKRLEYLSPRKFRLEKSFFPRLVKESSLYGYVSKVSYWWDVGTIDSYLEAERFLISDRRIIPPEK